jgi:nucleoside-diphosphate-sugar epimerase
VPTADELISPYVVQQLVQILGQAKGHNMQHWPSAPHVSTPQRFAPHPEGKHAFHTCPGGLGTLIAKQLRAREHTVAGSARSSGAHTQLAALDIIPVALDLTVASTKTLIALFEQYTAVIYAAGVAYDAPLNLLRSVHADAVVRAVAAASAAGTQRLVLISAHGVDDGGPPGYNTGWWTHNYAAKSAAERAVQNSTTAWTMLRPAGLTTEPRHWADRTSQARSVRSNSAGLCCRYDHRDTSSARSFGRGSVLRSSKRAAKH